MKSLDPTETAGLVLNLPCSARELGQVTEPLHLFPLRLVRPELQTGPGHDKHSKPWFQVDSKFSVNEKMWKHFEISTSWGAWLGQVVEHATRDPRDVESKPPVGVKPTLKNTFFSMKQGTRPTWYLLKLTKCLWFLFLKLQTQMVFVLSLLCAMDCNITPKVISNTTQRLGKKKLPLEFCVFTWIVRELSPILFRFSFFSNSNQKLNTFGNQ